MCAALVSGLNHVWKSIFVMGRGAWKVLASVHAICTLKIEANKFMQGGKTLVAHGPFG